MTTLTETFRTTARTTDPEVLVGDTDAILGDACHMLKTGLPSQMLRAVDAGTAIAFMSETTFREIGWMSAKAARWHEVDDAQLRELITTAYLRRIPVVATPKLADQQWMPDASAVKDPDDVVHVQVARLIGARAV